MPEISFTLDVFCERCGAELSDGAEQSPHRFPQDTRITVIPCEACLEAAKEAGYEDEHREGMEEAEGEMEKPQ